ncbi:MAG: hypothetical protein E7254_11205 [Lachnospiraceae bacterium]|nr:hypothetical protein [Lachnospiraceae bacterium]
MTVYIDEYFFINSFVDFLLILVASKIRKSKPSVKRMIVASLVGGGYSLAVLILELQNSILELCITYIVMSVLLALIAFGYINLAHILKNVVALFMVTFIFCGIINGLFTKNIIRSNTSLIVTAIIVSIVIILVNEYLNNNGVSNEKIIDVVLVLGERKVKVRALVDTGNFLREPITQKPVSIVRECIMKKLIEGNDNNLRMMVVPFRSVGRENGILSAYIVDKMYILKESGGIVVERPIIAMYKGYFSDKNEYDMLLHPKIEGKEEENV